MLLPCQLAFCIMKYGAFSALKSNIAVHLLPSWNKETFCTSALEQQVRLYWFQFFLARAQGYPCMRERLRLQVTGTQLQDALLPAIPAAVQNEAEQLRQACPQMLSNPRNKVYREWCLVSQLVFWKKIQFPPFRIGVNLHIQSFDGVLGEWRGDFHSVIFSIHSPAQEENTAAVSLFTVSSPACPASSLLSVVQVLCSLWRPQSPQSPQSPGMFNFSAFSFHCYCH